MTVLTWLVRFAIFALLVAFALQNTEPVNLQLLPGQAWQAPLVIALFGFFVGGVVVGALSLVGVLYRQRREISRLKRAAGRPPEAAGVDIPPSI